MGGGSKSDLLPDQSNWKSDLDVVRENNRFMWDSDEEDTDLSWNQRVSKKYWDRLNKEYCIGDLSRYKKKQYAFRWRTEKEVVDGFGQFTCGNKPCKYHKVTDVDKPLNSFEVLFNYKEQGEKKSALVKIRVCKKCKKKLKKEAITIPDSDEEREQKRRSTRRERRRFGASDETPESKNPWAKEKSNDQKSNDEKREDDFDEYINDLLM